MTVVTPTDRPKSLCNPSFWSRFVWFIGFLIFCLYMGFCNRNESDLLLFSLCNRNESDLLLFLLILVDYIILFDFSLFIYFWIIIFQLFKTLCLSKDLPIWSILLI